MNDIPEFSTIWESVVLILEDRMKTYAQHRPLLVAFLALTMGLGAMSMQAAQQTMTLRDAAKRGDVAAVRALLAAGVAVDTPGFEQETPLIAAIGNDHVELVRVLIAAGANVDAQTPSDTTPLKRAAARGCGEITRMLIDAGADLEINPHRDGTALIDAANLGRTEVVRLLIAAGAQLDVACRGGHTALILAAENDHAAVVRELLNAGASTSQANGGGYTALIQAVWSEEIVTMLLEAGAPIDNTDNTGRTALWYAVGAREAVLRRLIDAGADLEIHDEYGSNVLIMAAGRGLLNAARLLLNAGANVNATNKKGIGALMNGAKVRYVDISVCREMVRLLLDYGADIDIKTNAGETLLQCVTAEEAVNILQYHQERMAAIRLWAEQLHLKAGLPKDVVGLILNKMVFTDNQGRRFEQLRQATNETR